jgi:hypothetical protein
MIEEHLDEPKKCWCRACCEHRGQPAQPEPDAMQAAIEAAWDQHDANKLLADLFEAGGLQGVV